MNSVVSTFGRGSLAIVFLLGLALGGCTLSTVKTAPSPCANLDWYEAGRSDGFLGYPISKLDHYRQRCDSTPHPVNVDLYTNGREAGLVEFCSPTGGLEAGKSQLPYEKVCPENLESSFMANYELGRRIQELEDENIELESRVNNLAELMSPSSGGGGSIRVQIEQLKARQAKNSQELDALETRADRL